MIEFLASMKILHIVGARPQFIKAAMVSRAWKGSGEELILHTGQHYDENMSKLFFDELGLRKPDIHLGVGAGSHAEQTSRMLDGIDPYLESEKPDWVIIYGDTNSTLAGALCAAKRNLAIAHVEAGLRSFNRSMPEEINRILSDQVSDLLFCPTDAAVENLKKEGITDGVHQVGDVMADSLKFFLEAARSHAIILDDLKLDKKQYGLVTIHRSGNVDDRLNLSEIVAGLGEIDFPLVFPVHPRTAKMIREFGLILPENIKAIEPVGYLDMLMLEQNAECILTDSGGIQKEAYLMGVRCITMREETEWVETVTAGWNCLSGANRSKIMGCFHDFHPAKERPEIYGNGHAADKIIEILKSY
jgi:UDP-GlcNAc3NAcA epimerase